MVEIWWKWRKVMSMWILLNDRDLMQIRIKKSCLLKLGILDSNSFTFFLLFVFYLCTYICEGFWSLFSVT